MVIRGEKVLKTKRFGLEGGFEGIYRMVNLIVLVISAMTGRW